MVIFQGVSFSCSPKEGNMVKRFIAGDVVSAILRVATEVETLDLRRLTTADL